MKRKQDSNGGPPGKKGRERPSLVVRGVPEHFNYPWYIAQNRGLFDKAGVDVEFVFEKGGTGAMLKDLHDGNADIIIALTEGVVGDILAGHDTRIVGTYVQSPLCWAISTGAASEYKEVEDLRGTTVGVSRLNSGSHLMASVLASQRGWAAAGHQLSFKVEHDFEGLRRSCNEGATSAFMWETFTTKPFHDSGEVRRIGEITTPWACFVIAAREAVLDVKLDAVRRALAAVREAVKIFNSEPGMPNVIAAEFGLKEEDAKAWYEGVEITGKQVVSEAALKTVVAALQDIGVAQAGEVELTTLVDRRLCSIVSDIKSMKLYNSAADLVKRTHADLREAGLSQGPVKYTDLVPFDQHHHYHGADSIDACAALLQIDAKSSVLNVGAGLGGPARYLAGKYGAHVLAVELQHDLHGLGEELTARAGLSGKVTHMAGDFLTLAKHLTPGAHDHCVSWFAVLHIADREALWQAVRQVVKPGGKVCVDDFYERFPLTNGERAALGREMYCDHLPSRERYVDDLESNGFTDVLFTDLSEEWKAITRQRAEDVEADAERQIRVHGEECFRAVLAFYQQIAQLCENGNMGGARIVATRA